LIGEAIRVRRHEVIIHSKSGSPRDGSSDATRDGGDPRYLRQTCEQSLINLGIETLDVFCMSRVDPNVPIEESVGGMAELVKEGKTRFISLSECAAESLRRGNTMHPLVSLQMEYSLFSRDAEQQGQIDACKGLGLAMMTYAVLGRGLLSDQVPKVEELAPDDIHARLPRFHSVNVEKNLQLCSALEAIAHRKNATLAQLAIAWPMARGSRAGIS
jgi:aryl-alcohol dehydrogenase-like predicted oxidoreductase